MKSVLRFLCGTLITLFTLLCIGSFLYFYFTSPRFLLDVAKRTDYYEKANVEIVKNLDQQMVNENLKKSVHKVITQEKIRSDVDRMITSLYEKKDIKSVIQYETRMQLKNTLEIALQEDDFDKQSFDDLVNTLTISYMKDLFPYSEYTKLQSKAISVTYLIPMGLFFLLMIVLTILLSLLLQRKRPFEIFYRANYVSGILMICPFCFCHLYHLFQDFYYSNLYFSLYIRKTFYTVVDLLGMIGLLVLLVTTVFELREIKMHKKVLKEV